MPEQGPDSHTKRQHDVGDEDASALRRQSVDLLQEDNLAMLFLASRFVVVEEGSSSP